MTTKENVMHLGRWILIVIAVSNLPSQASTTAFSYQGQLRSNGEAVDQPATDTDMDGLPDSGGCSFRFAPYAAPDDGAPFGPFSQHDNVDVHEGLFTVPDVDFGDGIFDGSERWISIEVLCPGDSDWVGLAPLQPVTGAPYAVHGHAPWRMSGDDLGTTTARVGVGTLAPVEQLEVRGDLRIVSDEQVDGVQGNGALVVQNDSGTLGLHLDNNDIRTVGPGSLNLNGDNANNTRINNLLHVKVDGKVGIGTPSPTDALNVIGDVAIVSDELVDGTLGNGALVVRNGAGTIGVHIDSNDIRTVGPGSLNLNGDNANNTRINNLLHVKIDGKVGIGTATPDSMLEVSGTITTDVLTIKGGADLSERFEIDPGRGDVQPGAVVSIDPDRPGDLVVSAVAYDRRVAGVVSGAGGIAPGLVMGASRPGADGAYPVALTGRVYVKVDAAFGAVEPGDLLTSSSTPGHAMRVGDHRLAQGAVLGKAMSSLEKGRGLVLVLVTLQ